VTVGVVMFFILTLGWMFDEELNVVEGGPALAPGPFEGDPDEERP
jgi:hypothetical protein